jgi:hypothetical protein
MLTRRPRLTRIAAPLAAAALVTGWPAVARADMVWPGILLEGELLSWWAVGCGLVLEAGYLWWRLRTRPAWRALGESLAINGASALIGVVLVPLATFLSIYPAYALGRPFGEGAVNGLAWVVTLPAATLANVAVEAVVLEIGFGHPLSLRDGAELAGANAVTVLLAMASLWRAPIAP